MADPICLARSGTQDLVLLPALANRHGLITGATGTGKTVTLQKLAESFAALGVPVFMADVKGDLSGIGAVGVLSEKLKAAIAARHLGSRASCQHASILGFVGQIRPPGTCDNFRYGAGVISAFV